MRRAQYCACSDLLMLTRQRTSCLASNADTAPTIASGPSESQQAVPLLKLVAPTLLGYIPVPLRRRIGTLSGPRFHVPLAVLVNTGGGNGP